MKTAYTKMALSALVLVSAIGCKLKLTNAKLATDSAADSACSIESLKSKITQVAALDSELVLGQRFSNDQRDVSGNCAVQQKQCQSKCDADFWGITKLWYAKEFQGCMEVCFNNKTACLNNPDANPSIGTTQAAQTNRAQNLQTREALLSEIHSCTTSSYTLEGVARGLGQVASEDDEWKALRTTWKSHLTSDPLVAATFRFLGATYVDSPATLSSKNYAQWKADYEADHIQHRVGLKVLDVGLSGAGALYNGIQTLATLGIPSSPGNQYLDLSELAAPSQQVVKIVAACKNATDVCTAISCLGHRTQEVLSLYENIAGMKVLAKADDGREFALCRHYAPTFEAAFNMWAKMRGLESKINAKSSFLMSLFHAWPVVEIDNGAAKKKYIYDLLNDPFTPHLVPLQDEPSGSAITCLAVP